MAIHKMVGQVSNKVFLQFRLHACIGPYYNRKLVRLVEQIGKNKMIWMQNKEKNGSIQYIQSIRTKMWDEKNKMTPRVLKPWTLLIRLPTLELFPLLPSYSLYSHGLTISFICIQLVGRLFPAAPLFDNNINSLNCRLAITTNPWVPL